MLGLLAAGSAAILVNALQLRSGQEEEAPTIKVVGVAKDLPAGAVLTQSDVALTDVPTRGLPAGYLTAPEHVVGQVLGVPVVQGQILTGGCLVAKGTGQDLVRVLPPGMRAFTITLSSRFVQGGLIYPGCAVDVLAVFSLPSSDKGEAVSTTLLDNIQVLAVEDESVVSPAAEEEQARPNRRPSSSGTVSVTLKVTSKQAAALQLALQHGSIAVALRNPLDEQPVPTEGVILSRGRLAGEALDPAALAAQLQEMLAGTAPADANDVTGSAADGTPTAAAGTAQATTSDSRPAGATTQYIPRAATRRSSTEVEVIRGRDVETLEFELEEQGSD
jgi:pilus assembly protein CpaB